MNEKAAQSVYNLIKELEKTEPKPYYSAERTLADRNQRIKENELADWTKRHPNTTRLDPGLFPEGTINMLRTLPDDQVDAVQFNYAAYVRGEFADPVQPEQVYTATELAERQHRLMIDGQNRPRPFEPWRDSIIPSEHEKEMRNYVKQKEKELFDRYIKQLADGEQLTKLEQDYIINYTRMKPKETGTVNVEEDYSWWRDQEGEYHEIAKMQTHYLQNVYVFILRRNGNPEWQSYLPVIKRELIKRHAESRVPYDTTQRGMLCRKDQLVK